MNTRTLYILIVALIPISGGCRPNEDEWRLDGDSEVEYSIYEKSEISLLESTYYRRVNNPPEKLELIADVDDTDYSIMMVPLQNDEDRFTLILLNPRYSEKLLVFPKKSFYIDVGEFEYLFRSKLADPRVLDAIRKHHVEAAP